MKITTKTKTNRLIILYFNGHFCDNERNEIKKTNKQISKQKYNKPSV